MARAGLGRRGQGEALPAAIEKAGITATTAVIEATRAPAVHH